MPLGMQRFIQNLEQSPIPMRGLERFMQKRGMNFPISNTLNVQETPQKGGGMREFFSRFSRKLK
ncbi:MAG TPA: hypothetical protein VMW91_08635 [Desulfosporosinus sp.]|nr:hypothetical protein [Desulfosporosinus sp.]